MTSSKLIETAIILSIVTLASVYGDNSLCRVNSQRCIFPSPDGDYKCSPESSKTNGATGRHFCHTSPDINANVTLLSMGECDKGCFKEGDLSAPIEFGGEMSAMSVMCRTVGATCKFPFRHADQTYESCTTAALSANRSEESFLWCATEIDAKGNMLPNMWAICDLETCQDGKERNVEHHETEKFAEVIIDADSNKQGIEGFINLEQKDADSPIHVSGRLKGLPPGLHGFHVHEKGDTSDECRGAGGHFNPFNATHGGPKAEVKHVGDFGNVSADDNGVADVDFFVDFASLFGNFSLVGRTLVIHEGEDDLGLTPDDLGSQKTGNAGSRLACGIIRTKKSLQWDVMLGIIIVMVVIIVLIIVSIVFLVKNCLKKNKKYSPKDGPSDDVVTQNGVAKKTPLYDELSIPFIDASPTATPKGGRSADRFVNLTPSIGRSMGSLSHDEALNV